MSKLELLAREAADLNIPDADMGLVVVTQYGFGDWQVTVHVNNECARHHADDPGAETPVMREAGCDLDAVLDRMLARVQDAVADTPAEQVPA